MWRWAGNTSSGELKSRPPADTKVTGKAGLRLALYDRYVSPVPLHDFAVAHPSGITYKAVFTGMRPGGAFLRRRGALALVAA